MYIYWIAENSWQVLAIALPIQIIKFLTEDLGKRRMEQKTRCLLTLEKCAPNATGKLFCPSTAHNVVFHFVMTIDLITVVQEKRMIL